MVSTKEIILEISLGVYWILSSIVLGVFLHPILVVPNFILLTWIKFRLKRKKIIAPFVKEDFLKLGYDILKERPLKFSENKFEITSEPTINYTPISRFGYLRRFTRVFLATNKRGTKVLLNSIITKKWNGEVEIEILNIKNVS